ncbi:gamma-glutamyltranspeptidase / glutathione hydrolase [Sinosporangium album]|uniref:Gamma-glutamyltranspeptidase / glutathione hydrolase n=1 Tax=Sinosporangium album TaxID=504805 RepID=A0A1G8E2X3_9ACTN|nr:gamma-glutamyltransferase [Sinosporangium album]SDH64306.1 gamma-glutamyltranspeptidase / glutathione hydrolase [Sinosporangium album]
MSFTTRPELTGTFGAVSSSHWLATATGMAALEAGGNAFDAAVTTAFTLQVVEPHQNGPAGDVPIIFARADDKTPRVLCGQGPAPAGATSAHYRSLGLDLVPGSGPLAAPIPGATPALLTLLRDHGTMTLREVLSPAMGYAVRGFPLSPAAAETITAVAELFRDHWPTSAALYLPGGRAPKAGERFTNPTLAATFLRLITEGEHGGAGREAQIDAAITAWSEGFVAEAVDAFARLPWHDSSGSAHAGVLTGADMAAWRPAYEDPLHVDFRGHTVYKAGPWSQGPALLQQLALLEPLDLKPGTADYVHTVIEAAKLAFADREAWYGDGADITGLLAADYSAARRALIGDTASYELRPGALDGRQPKLPAFIEEAWKRAIAGGGSEARAGTSGLGASVGEPSQAARQRTGPIDGDTVHVDAVDRWGNIVAAMPSGGWLHASPIIPSLGLPLGTRLQMTWLEEGLPTTLTPGKRPRTTLSPSLVVRDGEPVLAFGSPGGDQQDQWQLMFLLNRLVAGMGLQAAIDAPTFHTAHFPSSFYPRAAAPGQVHAEVSLGAEVLDELRARGHEIVEAAAWTLSRMCAVGRDPETGFVHAAADPRDGLAYATGR